MTAVDTAATRSRPTGVQTARDLTLLLGRVGLAVLMIAHAKLEYDYAGGGIAGVGRLFAQAGVPLASLTGPANLLLETIGGVALILGLAVPGSRRADRAQHARRLGAGPPDGALRGRPHRPGDGDSDRAAEPGARRHRLRALRARPPDRQPPPGAPSDVSGIYLDRLSWLTGRASAGGPAERRYGVRNRIAATVRAAAWGSSPRPAGRAWLSQRVAKPCTRHQAAMPATGMSGPRRAAVTEPAPP